MGTRKDAEILFEKFHGRAPDPRELERLTLPDGSETWCLAVGQVDAIKYSTPEEPGACYEHFFTKGDDRPLVCVSADGLQMVIVRGRYRFTDRGFIG